MASSRHYNRFLQVSQNAAGFIKKISGSRVYFLVENRSANDIRMNYDNMPATDGTEGIQIAAGAKYELYEPFAPDNEVIWFIGQNGATLQNVNITEGYANK
jgi:hypothetical protein